MDASLPCRRAERGGTREAGRAAGLVVYPGVRRRGGPDKPESGRRAGCVGGFSPAGDARAGPTQMRRRPAEGADVEEGVIAE